MSDSASTTVARDAVSASSQTPIHAEVRLAMWLDADATKESTCDCAVRR